MNRRFSSGFTYPAITNKLSSGGGDLSDYVKKNMTETTTISNTGNTILRAAIVNISSTGSNSNVEIRPNGTGGVDVGGKKIKRCSGIESDNGDINLVVPRGSSVNMNQRHITNLPAPTADGHATPKSYVDGVKTLKQVDKANITLQRSNMFLGSDNSGLYCKMSFTNQQDKDFIRNALTAKKSVSIHFIQGQNQYEISNISWFGPNKDTAGFVLPPFWGTGELTSFLNKSGISRIDVLALGL